MADSSQDQGVNTDELKHRLQLLLVRQTETDHSDQPGNPALEQQSSFQAQGHFDQSDNQASEQFPPSTTEADHIDQSSNLDFRERPCVQAQDHFEAPPNHPGFTPPTASPTIDMASQGSAPKVVSQDYIVRQRYENKLPPPPGAPKLLEIPTPGLEPYTMPHYASRMNRTIPLNIEADAFLGMPIDLVGMPGVFDGDESSIQAPLVPPPVHPKDRNLLRPLKSLNKPKGESADVSFLRRTQYTAEDRGRIDPGSRNLSTNTKQRKKEPSEEDPVKILRTVIKGFDIANPESTYKGPDSGENVRGAQPTPAEIDAWKNPKHPSKPNLKVVGTYTMMPDLDAATDDHGFAVHKFTGNPIEATDTLDPRMDAALLHPLEPSAKVLGDYQAKVAAHKADPTINTDPGLPPLSYEFFLAQDAETAKNLSRKFNVDDPEKDSAELYTNPSDGGDNDSFRYNHVRIYDPGHQNDNRNAPYQEVALALHDPELEKRRAEAKGEEAAVGGRLEKAAYYYPVTHKTQLKPRRAKALAQMGMQTKVEEEEEEKIDNLDVTVREPQEEEIERRGGYKAALDTQDVVEAGEADAEGEVEA